MTTQPDPAAPAGVVVGVDGSEASTAALDWAADTAAAYRVQLTIVFARPDVEGDVVEAEQDEQVLDGSASAVRQRQPDLVVRALRYPDPPVQTLLSASAGADMLVLGSRGLEGFRGLLMGSTAMQVVPWAHCPVVVVHPPRESDEGEPLHPGQVVLGYDASEQADAAAVLAFGHARAIGSGVVAVAVDKARGESRIEDVDPRRHRSGRRRPVTGRRCASSPRSSLTSRCGSGTAAADPPESSSTSRTVVHWRSSAPADWAGSSAC